MEEQHQSIFENGYCGIDIDFHEDMHRHIASHLKSGFHFVFTPLMDPTYRPSLMKKGTDVLSLRNFADLLALNTTSNWSNCLVGKISSWIDLDSDDEILRKDSEIALWEEVHLASNNSLQVCLLPAPKGSSCSNYIRCVNQILQNLSNMQFLLRIPLEEPDDHNGGENIKYKSGNCESRTNSLELWRSFHRLCELKFHNQLSVAFDFPCSLPSANSLECWSDEPVGVAIIDSKTFRRDRWGHSYRVEYHKKMMMWLFKHSVKVVMSGTAVHNVHSELLALSATNTCNQDGDYSQQQHPLGRDLNLINLAHRIFISDYFGKEDSSEEDNHVFIRGTPDDDDFDFLNFD